MTTSYKSALTEGKMSLPQKEEFTLKLCFPEQQALQPLPSIPKHEMQNGVMIFDVCSLSSLPHTPILGSLISRKFSNTRLHAYSIYRNTKLF